MANTDYLKLCLQRARHLDLPQRSAMQGARLIHAIIDASCDGKQVDLQYIAGGEGKLLDRAIVTFLAQWGKYLKNCATGKQNQGKKITPSDSCSIDARLLLDSCSIDAKTPTDNQEFTANCLPPHIPITKNIKKKLPKKNGIFALKNDGSDDDFFAMFEELSERLETTPEKKQLGVFMKTLQQIGIHNWVDVEKVVQASEYGKLGTKMQYKIHKLMVKNWKPDNIVAYLLKDNEDE